MLQRSPSYVVSLPAATRSPSSSARVLRRAPRLRARPLEERAARHGLSTSSAGGARAGQGACIRKGLERELPAGYDIDTHFTPRYNPWDQRLCLVPDGDLFAAIRAGRASVVTDHIDTFTEPASAWRPAPSSTPTSIVTATGLELLFLGGIEVVVDGGRSTCPDLAYKGMMLEGVPNLAFASATRTPRGP